MSQQILKFSAIYKSHNIILSEKNKSAEVANSRGFCYIIADTEPIKKGIHCWRVKVDNPNLGWMMFGISASKRFKKNSYVDNTTWGISNYSKYYPYHNKQISSNNAKTEHWNVKNCEIDILVDVPNGTLRVIKVGDDSTKEAIIHNLPKNANHGWVPHFSLVRNEQKLRLTKIPIYFYGKVMNNNYDDTSTNSNTPYPIKNSQYNENKNNQFLSPNPSSPMQLKNSTTHLVAFDFNSSYAK